MSTLWTFGDSQTYGYGCRPDSPLVEYYENYKKEGDDIWPVLLASKLNCKLENYGMWGYSNDRIFDSIIEVFQQIKEGDYIVIGETFHNRFDVEDYRTNTLVSILGELTPDQFDKGWEKWINDLCRTEDELMTLLNFSLYFSNSKLLKERYHNRFKFIESIIPNNTNILIWSWESEINKKVQRIYHHTKGKINDTHFSFRAHKDFAQYAHRLLTEGKTIL
jgi:hypothetical protein